MEKQVEYCAATIRAHILNIYDPVSGPTRPEIVLALLRVANEMGSQIIKKEV